MNTLDKLNDAVLEGLKDKSKQEILIDGFDLLAKLGKDWPLETGMFEKCVDNMYFLTKE